MSKKRLKFGEYPDFYNIKGEVIKEEGGVPFVGRKYTLERLWDRLVKRSIGGKDNIAIIAPRRTGKTRLLLRFYNVAFWEQEDVVVLYYCFPMDKIKITDLVEDMVCTFISQWIAFVKKDPS
jgi:predicted AAA+ superfamily ATPase